jgi:hypothetical protein
MDARDQRQRGYSDRVVMHSAVIGAQIGVYTHFAGQNSLAFVPLPLIGAGIVIYTL